jgi:hypothetical protein
MGDRRGCKFDTEVQRFVCESCDSPGGEVNPVRFQVEQGGERWQTRGVLMLQGNMSLIKGGFMI